MASLSSLLGSRSLRSSFWLKTSLSSCLMAWLILSPAIVLADTPTAELPRIYIDTTWQPPVGSTWPAHNETDLKNALRSAQPGDTIVLDAGTIYLGNFTLPAKSNPSNQWIYIETSAIGSLPQPGTRVTPADATLMPKLVTPNSLPALTVASTGGYVRLVGIEMYSTSTYGVNPSHQPHPINGFSYYLLTGAGVSNVTVDRSYFHGSDTQDVNHGIGFRLNSSYIAVVDSDVRDIHGWTFDSQAIIIYSSPGPLKIVNNYLSATTEDVMLGGSGGYDNPYVPADLEIRHNHMYKPTAWISQTTGVQPWQWQVKNNFECKACLRLIFTGNILENAWKSGQIASNILLTPRTVTSGSQSVVDDITIQNNTLSNANIGFTIIGYDDNCVLPGCTNPGETKRIVIINNLILTRDPADQASYHPMGFSMGRRMDQMLIQHNTVQGINGSQSWASFYFNQNPCSNPVDQPTSIWIMDNVLSRQPTGDCAYQGQRAIDAYMPTPGPDSNRVFGDLMFVAPNDRVASWPAHNFATTLVFQFEDRSQGDYQLVSPTWTDTSDGIIAGVDMNALLAAEQ